MLLAMCLCYSVSYVDRGQASRLCAGLVWRSGNVICHISENHFTSSPVSTETGDRIDGILSRYVTSQLGQLSLQPRQDGK